MSPLPPTLESALAEWLPQQRWYPAKGRRASNRVVGGFELRVPEGVADAPIGGAGGARAPLSGGVTVTVHLVELHFDDGGSQLVQVPLVARRQPVAALAHALVGRATTPVGVVRLYDGPQDPAYVAALLAQLAGGHPAVSAAGPGAGWARGVPGTEGAAGVPVPCSGTRSRVLRGEQSNTSVIVDGDNHNAVIVKVFRTLQPGANPDIVLQRALSGAGSDRVPRLVGWVEGGWDDARGKALETHLAFASEFLAGSEDAFRVATKAVEADRDFAEEARALGAATADVHRLLAKVLPTEPATPARMGALAERLAGRARWAVDAVEALAPWASVAIEAADSVRQVAQSPDWQRVHGDYHLGQVLRPPGRDWVLLDFEGEPLVPLPERVVPECPLRDVAGMLRSFDYAARRLTLGLANDAWGKAATARVDAWEARARDAFCTGYGEVSGRDPREDAVLLRAFELDKALYEAVYESRNRPAWLAIPLGAVERLLG